MTAHELAYGGATVYASRGHHRRTERPSRGEDESSELAENRLRKAFRMFGLVTSAVLIVVFGLIAMGGFGFAAATILLPKWAVALAATLSSTDQVLVWGLAHGLSAVDMLRVVGTLYGLVGMMGVTLFSLLGGLFARDKA